MHVAVAGPPAESSHRPPSDPPVTWQVPSSSDPGIDYTVTRHADGSWDCTCRGCRYAARADGLCKHVDEKREECERLLTLAAIL